LQIKVKQYQQKKTDWEKIFAKELKKLYKHHLFGVAELTKRDWELMATGI